jgi:hypothetical protein
LFLTTFVFLSFSSFPLLTLYLFSLFLFPYISFQAMLLDRMVHMITYVSCIREYLVRIPA